MQSGTSSLCDPFRLTAFAFENQEVRIERTLHSRAESDTVVRRLAKQVPLLPGDLLSTQPGDAAVLLDFEPEVQAFFEDVVSGLATKPRSLPCKYFYDQRGSQLFDQICELDEYYLTRTESSIMARYGAEMAEQVGPGVMLVEYGSGSSLKTRILLKHLQNPVAYAPVDISREHLIESAKRSVTAVLRHRSLAGVRRFHRAV